jgi:hypothetical protein
LTGRSWINAMKNKVRKYAVYIVFIVAIAYGINFHFLQDNSIPEKEKPEPSQTETTHDTIEKSSLGTTYNLPKGWGKNPFKCKENMLENTGQSPINKVDDMPRLTGISYNKEGLNYAIIDNKVVQVGDKIDDWSVLLIQLDCVKIKKSGIVKKLIIGS